MKRRINWEKTERDAYIGTLVTQIILNVIRIIRALKNV